MRPVLLTIADGAVHPFNETFEKVCKIFQLTNEEMDERLPSGKQTIIRNRVAWAGTYLKKSGLLIRPERGYLQITELGQTALEEQLESIGIDYLKQFDAFNAFQSVKKDSDPSDTQLDVFKQNTDPVERLEEAHLEIQQELMDELLGMVKQESPQFLEVLVVELMQAMGYGGWSKASGMATQYTADGGIDGIINEDPLGLDTIYLQAKRYTNGSVGRPDIQAFVGALEMKRARKGVFITTSKFSVEAVEYVSMIEKKIVLIDGAKLSELMVKHGMGVTVRSTYQVKTIDSDYFADT